MANSTDSQRNESFLRHLDRFREELARSFKNKNPQLDGDALTDVTKRTIDRLVFMRFLEGKLIEPEPIVEKLGMKGTAWQEFVSASRRLEQIYNGIVFKRHGLLDAPDFQVDERAFASVRESLAHTNSPYDFNAIPIHILGSIYERFLGKVIVATGKRARIEEKPEVRKAGGVYYTPEQIVTYIVENSIGKLIAGKSPEQVAEMRFADIACGSGSFLLGVYDFLLRYHTAYYNEKKNRPKALKASCLEYEDGTLRLSLKQKRKILLNNIYGVDLDAQAVEVAQLSLFLKLLEEETTATAKNHQLGFRETTLPTLDKNIIHGNTLIDWDILGGQLFDSEEERKLYPLDFADRFKEIMNRGGFDAIVGNPPYGAYLREKEIAYLLSKYSFQQYQLDTYVLFVERALTLLKPNGRLGYIIPNTWLLNLQSPKIRRHLFSNTKIEAITHYKMPVFSQATVDTDIVIISNANPDDAHQVRISIVEKNGSEVTYSSLQKRWRDADGKPVNILIRPETEALVEKLNALPRLNDLCVITQGCKPFQVGKGKPPQTRKIVDEKPFVADTRRDSSFLPLLRGSLIQKYLIIWNNDYWISFGDWLAEPRYSASYDAPAKIVVRQTGDSLVATIDVKWFIVRDNLYTIVPNSSDIDLVFVLGLLNSKLLNWYYQNVLNPEKGEALAQVKRGHLAQLPIVNLAPQDKMMNLVGQMLEARRQLVTARTDRDKAFYASKCAALDRQIDALVYELYGLTDDEIVLIERTKP